MPGRWPARLRPDRLAALAFETPYLAGDVTAIADRLIEFRAALPWAKPHYPVRVNPAPAVISALGGLDMGFQAGSPAELKILMEQGVEASRVLLGNTVRSGPHLRSAFAAGVWRLAFESEHELRRIAEFAPGSCVYLQLSLGREAVRPIGADPDQACALLTKAAELGLVPYGLSVQLEEVADLAVVGQAMSDLTELGLGLAMLNLGSGFTDPPKAGVPASMVGIGTAIGEALDELLPYRPADLICEPGRYLVADSSVLVSTVLERYRRNGVDWLVLDAGIHQGLAGGWALPLTSSASSPTPALFSLAGPTADPDDVIAGAIGLPENIQPGDLVLFGALGAAYAQAARPRNLFV
nr:hypothetical protein [Kineosporia babensis]